MGRKELEEAYERIREEKRKIEENWYRVPMDWDADYSIYEYTVCIEWLNENVQGKYSRGWVPGSNIPVLFFEKESDAAWFILRWK